MPQTNNSSCLFRLELDICHKILVSLRQRLQLQMYLCLTTLSTLLNQVWIFISCSVVESCELQCIHKSDYYKILDTLYESLCKTLDMKVCALHFRSVVLGGSRAFNKQWHPTKTVAYFAGAVHWFSSKIEENTSKEKFYQNLLIYSWSL